MKNGLEASQRAVPIAECGAQKVEALVFQGRTAASRELISGKFEALDWKCDHRVVRIKEIHVCGELLISPESAIRHRHPNWLTESSWH